MVDRDINIDINADTSKLEKKIQYIEQYIAGLQHQIDSLSEKSTGVQQGSGTPPSYVGNPEWDKKIEELKKEQYELMKEDLVLQRRRLASLRSQDPKSPTFRDPGPETGWMSTVKEGETTYENFPVIDAKLSQKEVEQFRHMAEARRKAREAASQRLPTKTAISSNYLSSEVIPEEDIQLGYSTEDLINMIPVHRAKTPGLNIDPDEQRQIAAGEMHGPWVKAFRSGKLRGKQPANIKSAHARTKAEPIDFMETQQFITGIEGSDFNNIIEAVERWGDPNNVPTAEELDRVTRHAVSWAYFEKANAMRTGDLDRFYEMAPKIEAVLTSLQRARTLGRFEDTVPSGRLNLKTGAKEGLTRENLWTMGQLSKSFIPQRPSEIAGDFGSTHRMTQQLDSLARKGLAERVVSLHSLPPEMWAQTGMEQLSNVFLNSMNRWALTEKGKQQAVDLGVTEYPGYGGIETPEDLLTRPEGVNPLDVPVSFGVDPKEKEEIQKNVAEKAPNLAIYRASVYRETPEYKERQSQMMRDLLRYRRGAEPELLSKDVLDKIDKQIQFGPPSTIDEDLDLVQLLNTQASTSYQYAQPQATESEVIMDALRLRKGMYADTLKGKRAQAQDIYEMLSSKRVRSRIATREDALEITSMVSGLVKTHREGSEKGEPTLSPDQYANIIDFWAEIESVAAPGLYGDSGISIAGAKLQEEELARSRGGMKEPGFYASELGKKIGQPWSNVDSQIERLGDSLLSKTILYNEDLAKAAGFPSGWTRTWFDVDELKTKAAERFGERYQEEIGGKEYRSEEQRDKEKFLLMQEVQRDIIMEAYETLPKYTHMKRSQANVPIAFRRPAQPGGRQRASLKQPSTVPWEEYHPVAPEFEGLEGEELESQIAKFKEELGPSWEEAEQLTGQLLIENLDKDDWQKLSKFQGKVLTPLQSLVRAKEEAGIGPSGEPGVIPRANVASTQLRAAREFKRGVSVPREWRQEAAYRGLGTLPQHPSETDEGWLQKTYDELWGPYEEEEAGEVEPLPEEISREAALVTPTREGGRRARAAERLQRKRAANLGLILGVGLPIPGKMPNPWDLIKDKLPMEGLREKLGGLFSRGSAGDIPTQMENALSKGMKPAGERPNALVATINMDITKPEHLEKLSELAKKYPEMATKSWQQTIVSAGGTERSGVFMGSMMQDIRGMAEEDIKQKAEDLTNTLTKQFGEITTGYVTVNDKYVPALEKGAKATNMFIRAGDQLGKLSWSFTMLSMNALGVFFSMMSVVRILQQGLTMMFDPLKNVESLLEDIGWLQSRGIDAGLTPTEAIDGWMKLKDLAAMFSTMMAKIGVKILDDETYRSLQNIISAIGDFLSKPEIVNIFQNIFKGLEKNMPGILGAFEGILKILEWISGKEWLIPFVAWAGLIAWLAMPFLSIISAFLRIAQVSAIILGNWKLIAYWMGLTSAAGGTAAGAGAAAGTSAGYAASGYTLGGATAGAAGGALGAKGTLLLASQMVMPILTVAALTWVEQSILDAYAQWAKEQSGGRAALQVAGSWSGAGAVEGQPNKPIIDQILAGEKVKWYAKGGTLKAGQKAIVGEEGPEMVVPSGDVEVIPNDKLRFLADGTIPDMSSMSKWGDVDKLINSEEMINILNENYNATTKLSDIEEDTQKLLEDNGNLSYTQLSEITEGIGQLVGLNQSSLDAAIDFQESQESLWDAFMASQLAESGGVVPGGGGLPGGLFTTGGIGVNPPTTPTREPPGGELPTEGGGEGGGGGVSGTDWSINPETGENTFTGEGPTTYEPGEGGAPSVEYPTNPYSSPANQNGKWFETDNGNCYYTDLTGRTFGPYPEKNDQLLPPEAVTSMSQKTGSKVPQKSMMEKYKDLGVEWKSEEAENNAAVMERFKKDGGAAVWGSIEKYAEANHLLYYPEAAKGGLVQREGLVNVHPAEIISPIEKILPQGRGENGNTRIEENKTINFNININGQAADERTAMDLVNIIKRELFGVGWV